MKRIVTIIAVALSFSVAPAAQSQGRKVTILTVKGDTIEGILKGLSESEATVEIAGQPVKLPLESVQYLSFTGKLPGARDQASSASPMNSALAALHELGLAADTPMLRPQYLDRLQAHMPPVKSFLKTDEANWQDVRRALSLAVAAYESAASLDAWPLMAGLDIGRGGHWTKIAEDLSKNPSEATHSESNSVRQIAVGDDLDGRLGFGDRVISIGDRTWNTFQAYSDSFSFALSERVPVIIAMKSGDCAPHLILTSDEAPSKPLDTDAGGWTKPAQIKKTLNPGRYHVEAACGALEIGRFQLSLKAQ